MVDSCYRLDRVVPEGMNQVSRRSEVAYIHGAPSTPGYRLALLRKLSQCPRALTEITKPKQVRKMNLTDFLYQFNFAPHYETNPLSASNLPAPRCTDTVGHYLKKI